MKYKTIVLTKRGGPEVLQIREKTLRPPEKDEVQIAVSACGVGRTDVAMRYGYYPFAPKIPFVPGYEIVGTVSAVGPEVTKFNIGDSVAALTVHGGYAEFIFLPEEELVAVPRGISAEKAVSVILNYCTAYQIVHRTLKVEKGKSVLITGASGGVGSALVNLGKIIGLEMYGLASKKKHDQLIEQGVTPIDYNAKDWISKLNGLVPDGFDYVIDGIGGKYINHGYAVLKPEGKLAEYGYPSFVGMMTGLVTIKLLNLLTRKKGFVYGISANYKKDKNQVHEDLKELFHMIQEGKINPLIHRKFSILDARLANQVLEEGNGTGKIVLVKDNIEEEN